MDEVTIAIPFYRGLGFLREAIDSVLAQSSPGWRLLIVDDAASNSPARDVEALVETCADTRIRSVRNAHNLGMVGSWNRCLDLAETDLVTLLHGDDLLLPGYVDLMLRLGPQHTRAVALYCGTNIIDGSGGATFSFPDAIKRFLAPRGSGEAVLTGEAAATALMRGDFIMCPTLCFRRSVLRDRRFAPGWSQVQDLELIMRLLMDGDELVGTREIAYAYRRHDDSATALQSTNRLRFDEEFLLFDQVAERAVELGWTRTAKVARAKRIIILHLLYRAANEAVRLELRSALSTLRYLRSQW